MEETHVIVLKDGTTINAILNGNNYISEIRIPDEKLADENLVGMAIDEEVQTNMICCNHFQDEEGDHIIFYQLSETEQKQRNLVRQSAQHQADIDYILMLIDEE